MQQPVSCTNRDKKEPEMKNMEPEVINTVLMLAIVGSILISGFLEAKYLRNLNSEISLSYAVSAQVHELAQHVKVALR